MIDEPFSGKITVKSYDISDEQIKERLSEV